MQEPRSNRKKWYACCGAVVLLCMVVVLSIGYKLYPHWKLATVGIEPDLKWIEERTQIRFPASARLVNAHYWQVLQGRDLRAKVEISRSDLEGFIESMTGSRVSRFDKKDVPLDERLEWAEGMYCSTDKRVDWWHPESSRRFIAVSYSGAQMMIGLDDPEGAVIYMFWTR